MQPILSQPTTTIIGINFNNLKGKATRLTFFASIFKLTLKKNNVKILKRESFMSSLRRFFVDKIVEPLVIEGEEFRHAINVLRIKENEQIIVLDNSGYEYVSTITKINKNSFEAKIVEKQLSNVEATNSVKLFCGYLKGDKTELVVQKAVELGVKEIVVFDSQFSSSYINEKKLERLNKVSMEASKQCGRAIYPKITYQNNLKSALLEGDGYDNKLFACEFAFKNEVDYSTLSGSTAIVVGSEGGFSKEEYELSLSLGYKTVFLGKRILRAETASISLLAIVMHRLKELE